MSSSFFKKDAIVIVIVIVIAESYEQFVTFDLIRSGSSQQKQREKGSTNYVT